MTQEEILAIVNNSEKENITIELKSFRKIFNNAESKAEDGRKDLAAEISALSNRHGGKLILGLNDDGVFDGKANYDIDKAKEIINQVCHDNISPIIDCSTQYLQCKDGDLLIVYVPKRKNIPHAVITKREGNEIKNRAYYIRTSHGKRLVSDNQLEWLFSHHDDPNFSHKFRICVEFDRHLNVIGKDITHGVYYISEFIERLPIEELDKLKKDISQFFKLIIELFPYFIIKSISDYFSKTWYIGMNEEFSRKSSGPMITSVPCSTLPINISEIKTFNSSVLDTLSWNFNEILKEAFPQKIHIPVDTDIQIHYERDGRTAKIVLKNPAFSFEIEIGMLAMGGGLHQLNTLHTMLLERNPLEGQQYLMANFRHFDGAGYFTANFEFPEKDITEFKKFHHYSEILKKLIDDNWNFNKIKATLPSKEILMIDNKLDEVLEFLKKITLPNRE